jgi:transcriptional regulator with PAS, ATPase and Fis domain
MTPSLNTPSELRFPPRMAGASAPEDHSFGRIIGWSPRLREAIDKARALARVRTAVLLQGETGAGKEVFARALHAEGPEASGPFVAINCGGLSRDVLASELFGYVEGAFTGARRSGSIGRMEAASGGTLFLDEIAEMPLDLQPFLLRVLENGEIYPVGSNKPRSVRFRLVAACNRPLRAEVNCGHFRMDLYYRISVTSLAIPSLRERSEDIPELVEHFVREAARRHGLPVKHFSEEVIRVFLRYSWPGNVRELRNVVEAMFVLTEGEVITLAALPRDLAEAVGCGTGERASDSVTTSLEGIEREAIREAIRMNGGNLAHAAKELNISRSTLYLKIRRYQLEPALIAVRQGTPGPSAI